MMMISPTPDSSPTLWTMCPVSRSTITGAIVGEGEWLIVVYRMLLLWSLFVARWYATTNWSSSLTCC